MPNHSGASVLAVLTHGRVDLVRNPHIGHGMLSDHSNRLAIVGLAAFRAEDYTEAIRALSSAVASKPDDIPARAMLGMSYTAQDKYRDAVKTFTPLGKKGMQDAAAGYAWALSLTRLGELPKASEVLDEFQKQDRPNDMLMLVGQLWLEIADYSRSVATFRHVLEKDPAHPKAHYFAGQACIRWQHWEEAAKEFQAEVALAPNDADAKFNRRGDLETDSLSTY